MVACGLYSRMDSKTVRTIGIFGGSFNPPHAGHVAIAEAVLRSGLVDEVWFVLSPQNPLKHHGPGFAPEADRLAMLRLAVEGHQGLKVSDVELRLPRPSYTVNTLRHLAAENPGCRFRLIIGEDNWAVFPLWREHDVLLRDFRPIVYRRGDDPGTDRYISQSPDGNTTSVFGKEASPKSVPGVDVLENAGLFPVSSTGIRDLLANGGDVNNLLDEKVYNYIRQHGLYGVKTH